MCDITDKKTRRRTCRALSELSSGADVTDENSRRVIRRVSGVEDVADTEISENHPPQEENVGWKYGYVFDSDADERERAGEGKEVEDG